MTASLLASSIKTVYKRCGQIARAIAKKPEKGGEQIVFARSGAELQRIKNPLIFTIFLKKRGIDEMICANRREGSCNRKQKTYKLFLKKHRQK
ncbi:MAG: hypothetical protein K2O45_04405 [Oscillospiraceae bacterium]|nr:hypothetical protein [Oscillospiraceae bacterium]